MSGVGEVNEADSSTEVNSTGATAALFTGLSLPVFNGFEVGNVPMDIVVGGSVPLDQNYSSEANIFLCDDDDRVSYQMSSMATTSSNVVLYDDPDFPTEVENYVDIEMIDSTTLIDLASDSECDSTMSTDYCEKDIENVNIQIMELPDYWNPPDVSNYLERIKGSFGDQPHVYDTFVSIMSDYNSERLKPPNVIGQVMQLFLDYDRPDLIDEFSAYLPPGNKIKVKINGQALPQSINLNKADYGYTLKINKPELNEVQNPENGSSYQTVDKSPEETSTPNFFPRINEIKPPKIKNRVKRKRVSLSTSASQRTTKRFKTESEELHQAIQFLQRLYDRFSDQPHVYRKFLAILHKHQQNQNNVKNGLPTSSEYMTEISVYFQVAKLFANQEDLLQEFSQFLSASVNEQIHGLDAASNFEKSITLVGPSHVKTKPTSAVLANAVGQSDKQCIKSVSFATIPLAEAKNYEALRTFLDKVRRSVNTCVYEKLIRCLLIYQVGDIVDESELIEALRPNFLHCSELWELFLKLLNPGHRELEPTSKNELPADAFTGYELEDNSDTQDATEVECLIEEEKDAGLFVRYPSEIENYISPRCSNRDSIGDSVLNDLLLCGPPSAESAPIVQDAIISSKPRKTKSEEIVMKYEDKRFELGYKIDLYMSAKEAFMAVNKKMLNMSKEKLAHFHLDESLGGRSTTIQQKIVRDMYKREGHEMIERLKKSPEKYVPVVLTDLESIITKLRHEQTKIFSLWKMKVIPHVLKSLDFTGGEFMTSDMKKIASKALNVEIKHLRTQLDKISLFI